jgi:hypothetical protein
MWADAAAGLSSSPLIFAAACLAFAVYLPTSQVGAARVIECSRSIALESSW